jgi:hypothetical protein
MNNWWVEVHASGTPISPCKKPVQSDTKPRGYFYGAFHCADCASTCVSFGKTEKQAYEFCHGTEDEKFCTFLSIQ